MGGALSLERSRIVRAFHATLGHQLLIVLALAVLVVVGGNVLRGIELRRRTAAGGARGELAEATSATSEPAPRRLLRIGFGLLWLADGLLQSQSAMPIGMPSQVMAPTADASPTWVQHVVSFATTTWSAHPVTAAVAVVWIQCGIGAWLLIAPRGALSRLAGGASTAWALVVFVFGESFGAMLAPGASWLFGAPGAALFYGVAGVLLALPEARLGAAATGRNLLRGLGALFVAMAVLQAWPGRGFWRDHGRLGAMVASMAATPQPPVLAGWLRAFGTVVDAHAATVNALIVVLLVAIGVGLWIRRPALLRAAVVAAGALGLAVWVLVQDLGVLGGLGTDPNSIPPQLVLLAAGALAALRPSAQGARVAEPGVRLAWTRRLSASPSYGFRTLAALGAVLVVVLGVAPIAVASMLQRGSARALVREAAGGSPVITDVPAPRVGLVDQHGRKLTLAALHGDVVLLTLLDPLGAGHSLGVARELAEARRRIGAANRRVTLVAIDDDPRRRTLAALRAFDRRAQLSDAAAWHFLTGPLPALRAAWAHLGVAHELAAHGQMPARDDVVWVIDPSGAVRAVLATEPVPATPAGRASLEAALAALVQNLLAD